MLNSNDIAKQAHDMAEAVVQARVAYLALINNGVLPDDGTLARSNEYKRLLNAGRTIRSLGNRDTFNRLLKQLFADDPELSRRAAQDLPHLWAGFLDWPDPPHPLRLN
jgi:hypothetical protein